MRELQPEFDWLYGTQCDRCNGPATIQYTIWSDVYKCCRCGHHMVLWDVAVDHESGAVRDAFACPSCGFTGKKTKHTRVDSVPVVTNYECQDGCRPKRSEHRTTGAELQHIEEINASEIPYWYPTDLFSPDREMWRGGHRDAGITRVCDFYTKRNLWALAAVWAGIEKSPDAIKPVLRFIFTALSSECSKRSRVGIGYYFKGGGGPFLSSLSGTLYVPSFNVEKKVSFALENRAETVTDYVKIAEHYLCDPAFASLIRCGAAAHFFEITDNSIDYIFTDPPFGSNIFYAD